MSLAERLNTPLNEGFAALLGRAKTALFGHDLPIAIKPMSKSSSGPSKQTPQHASAPVPAPVHTPPPASSGPSPADLRHHAKRLDAMSGCLSKCIAAHGSASVQAAPKAKLKAAPKARARASVGVSSKPPLSAEQQSALSHKKTTGKLPKGWKMVFGKPQKVKSLKEAVEEFRALDEGLDEALNLGHRAQMAKSVFQHAREKGRGFLSSAGLAAKEFVGQRRAAAGERKFARAYQAKSSEPSYSQLTKPKPKMNLDSSGKPIPMRLNHDPSSAQIMARAGKKRVNEDAVVGGGAHGSLVNPSKSAKPGRGIDVPVSHRPQFGLNSKYASANRHRRSISASVAKRTGRSLDQWGDAPNPAERATATQVGRPLVRESMFDRLTEAKVGDYITTKSGDKGYVLSSESGRLAVRRLGGKPSSEGGVFYTDTGDAHVNPGGKPE